MHAHMYICMHVKHVPFCFEQRKAKLDHKEPGGGIHRVTEWTEGAVIITDNTHIILTTCTTPHYEAHCL